MKVVLFDRYRTKRTKLRRVWSKGLSWPTVGNLAIISRYRWYSIHTFLSSLGMLGITQLKSILFADHITFSNAYLKRFHTRQRMTNNNNNNKRKQV